MKAILVTGASSFLGYHVAKRLNDIRVRPRVLELRDADTTVLTRLDVERCPGHLEDLDSVRRACEGVDTVLHLAFKVSVGGGAALLEEMQRINVEGTRNLLRTAAAAGIHCAVVTGSALAVGVNRQPVPLDENANWPEHAFDLPYAKIRREAELAALAHATSELSVMTVCPSFTFGPDDPTGAPANKLLKRIVSGKVLPALPVGFGCLDVRDFAHGMLLASERGRSGQRYLLSGENVTTNQLLDQASAIAGVRGARLPAPTFLLSGLVGALEFVSRVRGKPAPVTRDALQLIGRYAWYDTSKARTELGWTSRALRETLADTIQWLRSASPTTPRQARDARAPHRD